MESDLTVSLCCRGTEESALRGMSRSADTLAQSYVNETSQTPGTKEKKQSFVTDPVILVCSSRGRNNGSHQQGWNGLLETLEGTSHKIKIITARVPFSFIDYPF